MPFTHNISEEEQIAFVKANGKIDLKSCIDAVRDVANAFNNRSHFGVLVDLRAMDYSPRIQELRSLAQILGERKSTFRGGVAIIMAEEKETIAFAACTIARAWGFVMKPFTDLIEAKKYLKS